MQAQHGQPEGSSAEATGLDLVTARAMCESAPDGIAVVEAGTIVYGNTRLAEMLGYDEAELTGQAVELLVPDELQERHVDDRAEFEAHPTTRPMGLGLDLEARCADGSTVPVEISLSPLLVGDRHRVIAIVRDVTERTQAEARLRAAEREVQLLDERTRIGRNLHDTVIQRLFAAGLSLEAISTGIEGPAGERLHGVIDELDGTIREIRTAIFGLQARPRREEGLRSSALSVISEASRILGFEPQVTFAGPADDVDEEVADHAVTVLREALSNVARHAEASSTSVVISATDELTVVVEDDGRGLGPRGTAGGYGLGNLVERAAQLGGHCFIEDAGDDAGTRLEWRVPLGADSTPT